MAQPAVAGDDAEAVRLFRDGEKAYREGNYRESVRLLLLARRLRREPVLLYDLARAYDARGDRELAMATYEDYLREDPNTKDAPRIRARIESLRKKENETSEIPRIEHAAERPKESLPPSHSVGAAPWLVAGAGLLLAGAGVGVGLNAKSRQADAVAEPIQAKAASIQDEADARAVSANILILTGGIVALAGLTWGFVDLGMHSGKATAYVGPFGAGLRGTF